MCTLTHIHRSSCRRGTPLAEMDGNGHLIGPCMVNQSVFMEGWPMDLRHAKKKLPRPAHPLPPPVECQLCIQGPWFHAVFTMCWPCYPHGLAGNETHHSTWPFAIIWRSITNVPWPIQSDVANAWLSTWYPCLNSWETPDGTRHSACGNSSNSTNVILMAWLCHCGILMLCYQSYNPTYTLRTDHAWLTNVSPSSWCLFTIFHSW